MHRSSSHYGLVLNLTESNVAKLCAIPNNVQMKVGVKSTLIVSIIHPVSVCIYSGPLYHIISYETFCVTDEGLIMDLLR